MNSRRELINYVIQRLQKFYQQSENTPLSSANLEIEIKLL